MIYYGEVQPRLELGEPPAYGRFPTLAPARLVP
jgi:hypothetical protein